MVNRRGFLIGAAVALALRPAAAPAGEVLTVAHIHSLRDALMRGPVPEVYYGFVNPILAGQIGRWEGVRIYETPRRLAA